MSGVIENVLKSKQGQHAVYIFAMSAKELRRLGTISRLHDHEGGVQRKLDQAKSAEIFIEMQNPKNLWLDTFLAHMEPDGSFEFIDGQIIYDDRFKLSIDDGQHRHYALEELDDEVLERLGDFTVTAASGLTFEERLALFMQQQKRRPVDKNLLLQGRNILHTWNKPVDEQAYQIVLALNQDERSPLCGKVQVDEVVRRAQTGTGTFPVTATGLQPIVRSLLNPRTSVIGNLSMDQQKDVIIRYLQIAATRVWADDWKNTECILSGGRGIAALLALFTSSDSMRIILTTDFGNPPLFNALRLASHFSWDATKNKNKSTRQIVQELDAMISRAYRARTRNRDNARK